MVFTYSVFALLIFACFAKKFLKKTAVQLPLLDKSLLFKWTAVIIFWFIFVWYFIVYTQFIFESTLCFGSRQAIGKISTRWQNKNNKIYISYWNEISYINSLNMELLIWFFIISCSLTFAFILIFLYSYNIYNICL